MYSWLANYRPQFRAKFDFANIQRPDNKPVLHCFEMVRPGFKTNILMLSAAAMTELLRWIGLTEMRADDIYGYRPVINEIISHFSQEDHDWLVDKISQFWANLRQSGQPNDQPGSSG